MVTDGAAAMGLVWQERGLSFRAAFRKVRRALSLVLVLFAGTYVAMAAHSASNFGEHLTHTDALYFTVTVFSRSGSATSPPRPRRHG